LSGKPDPTRELNAKAVEILTFLNARTGKRFQAVPATIKPIVARLKEGASEADCRAVVDQRIAKWGTDPKMEEYLRPATLFGATNFAQYVGEVGVAKTHALEYE
jgi:uncharacterized phage protein (TIGR02220 family)